MEPLHRVGAEVVQHCGGRVADGPASPVEDEDAVAHLEGDVKVMGDQQDAHSLVPEAGKEAGELLPGE